MNPMQSRSDISKFDLPIKGTANYKGIDKNGKATKEINSHGKFASRKVKTLKSAFDKIDKFFHLKSKDFVNRKISERKAQKILTQHRADILFNRSSTPNQAVQELYNLIQEATAAGVKSGKIEKVIENDVKTFLTHQINNATTTDELKAAYDGFYENHRLMTPTMKANIENQITQRFKNMVDRFDKHFNLFRASTFNSVDHYIHTRNKCMVIKSTLELAEKIKCPSKSDSNLVGTYKDTLREYMTKVITTDLKNIAGKLTNEGSKKNTNEIRKMLETDFGDKKPGQDKPFEDFFRIGSKKPDSQLPNSLKKIRQEIENIKRSFPNKI